MDIAIVEARLQMLALAVECIGVSLPASQAREVAAGFGDSLSLLLAEQRPGQRQRRCRPRRAGGAFDASPPTTIAAQVLLR